MNSKYVFMHRFSTLARSLWLHSFVSSIEWNVLSFVHHPFLPNNFIFNRKHFLNINNWILKAPKKWWSDRFDIKWAACSLCMFYRGDTMATATMKRYAHGERDKADGTADICLLCDYLFSNLFAAIMRVRCATHATRVHLHIFRNFNLEACCMSKFTNFCCCFFL